ncbi:acetoacetate decarboxylase family protein [Cryptosporangium aurantiacum]|uniref:Acetoacetate decarboxylase (ADC) n=1 Tax=Cryptosporangium aurantiacum TaxID=134849 RepID=A0A1M7RKQ4_9ACTN|nr:acetoacetate decarboxylase family protein [Cryptosporangium aurantiacum]SHN46731.1 Acetoacetate decarboxylase (ADC) [Cryptosporangium aurantiacum]
MTTHQIAGQSVTMPVQVRDASAGTVLFEVDATAAAALLPTDAFEIVETTPGRAHLALVLVDYRDNDLGAYHEVGLTFFVRPRSGGEDGTFITRLPVDQPFTCEAGLKIWGFPKTIEQIDVENTDTSSTWTLRMDGQLALAVRVPRGGTDPTPPSPMTTYSLLDGVPHSTVFTQGGEGSQVVIGGEGVQVTLGQHPVGRELASLGLPDAPVVLSSWIERMKATFENARPLTS